MTPDQLLKQITELSEDYAKAHTCHSFAQASAHDAERAHLTARAEYWDAQVADRYNRLTAALNSAIPPTVYAALAASGCVRITSDGTIEFRGDSDQTTRAVTIRMSPVQAVAAGTTLIACATASVKHLGGHLAEILPSIPPSPPGPVLRSS
ncbi:MAG: hypothetical protein JXA67_22015 [Micromonosporaceae bacterium]|nr:hypothetical protein [Micromonosporaceae bacterium]